MRRTIRTVLNCMTYGSLFLSTMVFLAVLTSWIWGSMKSLSFTWSDRGLENRLSWAGNERVILTATMNTGWFCSVFRYHTKPYPVENWTCGGPLARPFELGQDLTRCPRAANLGWPLPLPGRWMLQNHIEVEIANNRICHTDGQTTRVFDVSNHAGWVDARANSALAVPDQLRRHYEVWLAVPFWFLALLFGVLPLTFAARRLVRRRRGLHDCRQCGYNLTGNTSGICPECGTPRE